MAVTYFGLCNSAGVISGDDSNDSSGATPVAFWNGTEVWTCPGTGTQNIVELSVYGYINTGTPNIRLSIYSSDGATKIAEGTAEVAVTGGSYSWQGHMTAASMGNATLVGGTSYKLVCGADNDMAMRSKSGSSGIARYTLSDYTGGSPSSLPAGTGNTLIQAIRCGVEPAAGGGVVTGTATASITEADVVTGGKEIIITLTGDTFIA
jgi:hypothetical protein